MKTYYKYNLDFIINIKKIVTIDYFLLPSDYFFPAEKHNFYEFVYVENGSITYSIDNEEYHLKKQEILIVEPNKTHFVYGDKKNETKLFNICFECFSPYIKQLNQFKCKLNSHEKGILNNIFKEANCTYVLPLNDKKVFNENPPLGGEQITGLYLELLFILLLRNKSKKNPYNFIYKKTPDDLLLLITDYLEKSLYKRIDLPTLCKNFNYSKSFICNYFKYKTGETIIEYFNNLKIREAKRMLLETNYTSEQISDLLSFSDPRYFLYLFKKKTNKTPKQYRNSKFQNN